MWYLSWILRIEYSCSTRSWTFGEVIRYSRWIPRIEYLCRFDLELLVKYLVLNAWAALKLRCLFSIWGLSTYIILEINHIIKCLHSTQTFCELFKFKCLSNIWIQAFICYPTMSIYATLEYGLCIMPLSILGWKIDFQGCEIA